MAILNSIAGFENDMAKWRRHLHQNPELGRDCYKTAKYIQERLKEFGITEIHTGYASTGIVAIIEGKASGRTIGLRADMDALPIKENTGMSYSSKNEGVMHACGHDGHTTMLLGAARYLSETRNFSGRVALIFQPDEEATGGAEAMVEEGILEEFNIEEVYALHNTPSHDVGVMYTRPGPIMAGADSFTVEIQGKGGHAAYPHEVKDPIVAAISIAQSFQTIVSRNNIPSDDLVISITQVHSGTTDNVVPEIAYLNGTVRTFDLSVQEMVIKRMEKIISGLAMSFEVNAKLNYQKGYPPTINHEESTNFAIGVAEDVCGSDKVLSSVAKEMGAEDFSYMLQKRPGAYLFMGIGDGAGLHNPNYDFNDAAAPVGASFFARLIEKALPLV
ncbi:MAG: M20 family metallopeptidase [Paracoccaceae bacterium]|jgi:hippurate hydrolase|nr:M20 family metallopeptidase [Paracoccaceae bacterium]|tara:strand:- start:95 stop:1258 length:1164 start_codon:yes stop_codon:yes gene_type:complete